MVETQCELEERCIHSGWVSICRDCINNKNAKLTNKFKDRGYIPTCKHGYKDCVGDPAYMKTQGYIVNDCEGCITGEWYDDEDK